MNYSKPPGREHLISEGDCCPAWQPCQRISLVMLHECWFCKWGGFDPQSKQHQSKSTCHYENENKNERKESQ